MTTIGLQGQDSLVTTRHLTIRDGLSNHIAHNVLQDSDGFLWITTDEGLNRFDGNGFQWFTRQENKLLGNLSQANLKEDKWKRLWIMNHKPKAGEGLFIMDIRDFDLKSFYELFNINESYAIKTVTNQNNEIVVQLNDGICYQLTDKDQLTKLPFSPNFKLSEMTDNGDFLGLLGQNIIKYDAKGHILKSIPKETEGDLFVINEDDLGNFWWYERISDKKNRQFIFGFKTEGNTTTPFNPEGFQPHPYRLKIKKYKGNIIIQDKYDIIIVNPKTLEINDKFEFNINKYKRINDFIFDDQNTLWITTQLGLIGTRTTKNHFHPYFSKKQTGWPRSLRAILETDGFIYASYKDLGRYNKSTNQFEVFSKNLKSLVIKKDNDFFWSADRKLIKLNATTGDIVSTYSPKKHNSVFSYFIQKADKTIWLTTQKGLFFFNENEHDSIQYFNKNNGFEDFENSRKWQIVEHENDFWVVTFLGLFRVNEQLGVLEQYHKNGEGKFYLPTNEFQHLHIDKNGLFHLSSEKDGLIIWDRKNGNIEEINRSHGLLTNNVYSALEDEFGFLWLSTQIGLVRMNKATKDLKVYLKEDGITDDEFNRSSYHQSKDGTICFGGLNGLVSFNPKDFITQNASFIPIKIASVNALNAADNETIKQKVTENNTYIFEPTFQSLNLKLSLQDYISAHQTTYFYKINNQKKWAKLDGNLLTISGLNYGTQEIKVYAKGNSLQSISETLVLKIIVKRPFYLSWWFILTFVLGIILLSWQFYHWRIQNLQQRQTRLESIVKERTKQIQKDKAIIETQAVQLKELDKVKSRFFANISHELRTPLTLILTPLENTLNRNKLDNKDFTSLTLMYRNGEKLLKRINELLDLSRLDANKIKVNEQPLLLYSFLKKILSTFEGSANLKDVRLNFEYEFDHKLQLILDEDKVEKIILNYLSNALKFTPKNGEIKLSVQQQNGRLQLSVSDTGIGILPDELPKIFDRFYQSKDVVRKRLNQQGTGIGLSLCQELAKVLKGKVWATSEIGKGSIFFVELPYIETFAIIKSDDIKPKILAPIITSSEDKTNISNEYRPTILVVEDNNDLRQYMKTFLSEKYNIVTASNGKIALQKLGIIDNEKTPNPLIPNLIISDIMMPEMDGMELLKILKEDNDFRAIPIIMLTAQKHSEVKIEALRIGVDDYLTKPFKAAELFARAENLIKNATQRYSKNTQQKLPLSAPKTTIADTKWLKMVEEKILENIENSNFNLNQLASELFIAPRTMQKKIKRFTGKTPKQYQRTIQMHFARTKLKNGEVATISELSTMLGYEDAHYFSKLYKQQYGVTPKEDMY